MTRVWLQRGIDRGYVEQPLDHLWLLRPRNGVAPGDELFGRVVRPYCSEPFWSIVGALYRRASLMTPARFYRVEIWELDAGDECWLGPAYANATRVASVTLIAPGPRQAAARAYVCVLSRHRTRVLTQLQALGFCIRAERNVQLLARGLVRTADWAGPCFQLSNMVQTWQFRVGRLPLNRVARVRLAARLAARARRSRRLLIGGCGPSPN